MRNFLIILILGLIGCNSITNFNKIKLKYEYDLRIYSKYNLLYFRDSNDSLYYVITQFISNDSLRKDLTDSLIENNFYELELMPVPKGLYMKSIVRGSWPFSFMDHKGEYITIDDTLVGTVYQSPNIIGKCYVKR